MNKILIYTLFSLVSLTSYAYDYQEEVEYFRKLYTSRLEATQKDPKTWEDLIINAASNADSMNSLSKFSPPPGKSPISLGQSGRPLTKNLLFFLESSYRHLVAALESAQKGADVLTAAQWRAAIRIVKDKESSLDPLIAFVSPEEKALLFESEGSVLTPEPASAAEAVSALVLKSPDVPPPLSQPPLLSRPMLSQEILLKPQGPTLDYPFFLSDEDYQKQSKWVGSLYVSRGHVDGEYIHETFELYDGFRAGRPNGCGLQALGINVNAFKGWFEQNDAPETRKALQSFICVALREGSYLSKYQAVTNIDLKSIIFRGKIGTEDQYRSDLALTDQGIDFFKWYLVNHDNMFGPGEVTALGRAFGKSVHIIYDHMPRKEDEPLIQDFPRADIYVRFMGNHFQRAFWREKA